ncbi:JAB domain-containing protein [Pedobacter heparinus]|uniref:JAB domain-containing protein n=1 Tax=Pedobacter heparinus TaxID=984 RepID=UPI00292F2E02|nr:JAB domain-containing protein [Pedobacter heparinus]
MIKEVIGHQKTAGCWILLFDNTSLLKHKQKLGTTPTGFGDPRNVLQLSLQHQCLSMVLVSHSLTPYTASRTDLIYNLNLIAAANNISICLLDHIVTYPEGYYSYRDNGLLTYMRN